MQGTVWAVPDKYVWLCSMPGGTTSPVCWGVVGVVGVLRVVGVVVGVTGCCSGKPSVATPEYGVILY